MQLSSIMAKKNEVLSSVQTKSANRQQISVLVTAATLLVIFCALFTIIQFAAPGLAGNDGYYHVKMGYLIGNEGLKPVFDVLPHTILNEAAFYDHHLLYHVYLSLFARVDPTVDGGLQLTQGAKMASILLPSLAFLAIWWLLRAQNVPWPALWALALFAVSEAFLYRMSMPRAQAGSLLLLILGLQWLLNGRYRWLLPLGFVFVWFYNAFPLLLIMAGIYMIAVWMLERRLVWQALAYPLAGILLGLLINPYFPENLTFIAGHLLPKVGESATRVGNEWTPYRTWTIVENSGLALAFLVLGALAMGWHKDRMNYSALAAFGLAIFFGFMLFKSRRFVEYFPPFALIFLALSASPLLAKWQDDWRRQAWVKRLPGFQGLLPLLLLLLLVFPLFVSVRDARDLVEDSKPADRYAAAALWLQANSEPGSKIFQTDWDDFTRLYFYNSDAVYTAGLDPTFMELYDQQLFDQWVDITRGRVDRPGELISTLFDAQFVFSDTNHESFLENAAEDPQLVEIFRDGDAVIFSVQKE